MYDDFFEYAISLGLQMVLISFYHEPNREVLCHNPYILHVVPKREIEITEIILLHFFTFSREYPAYIAENIRIIIAFPIHI